MLAVHRRFLEYLPGPLIRLCYGIGYLVSYPIGRFIAFVDAARVVVDVVAILVGLPILRLAPPVITSFAIVAAVLMAGAIALSPADFEADMGWLRYHIGFWAPSAYVSAAILGFMLLGRHLWPTPDPD